MSGFPDPVISVIIPVHNAEDTIERTIDSVLDQTYNDYEIIVIDDGSSDTTGQLLEKYFSKINLIKGQDLGVAAARNSGLEVTRGKYVAFLDHDDSWIPKKLEMQVEILDKYPSVGLTFGNLECVDKKGNSLGFMTCKPEDCHSPSWEELLIHSIVYISTVLVRKNLLDKVGRFDTSFVFGYEDTDLYLRLRELTSFHFLDFCLGKYCFKKDEESPHHYRYLKSLPYYAKKYWNHRHIRDPWSKSLQEKFFNKCIGDFCYYQKDLLKHSSNRASHERLAQLNDSIIEWKEIFEDPYKSRLITLDLKQFPSDDCISTLLFVYLTRRDLQMTFPEVISGDLNAFIEWASKLSNETPLIDDDVEIFDQFRINFKQYLDKPNIRIRRLLHYIITRILLLRSSY